GMQELKEQLDARAEQLGQTALDKVARNTPRIHAQPAAMKAEKPAPEAKHFPTARIIDENPKLPRMARAFLTALAQWGPMSKGRLLVLTTYRSSGPVSNTFATLTRDGLIGPCEKGIGITEGGINALGSWEPLPRGHELREKIMRDASTMEAKFLAVIFDTYPEAIQKKDLLETTGYASSGPVSNAFARLVASGFVTNEARGQLRAADALME
ncbi:MAG TPA: hypothetical protein VJS69_02520, partial [Candidatus Krumholzibacteria bacterium]|nr:hypothetical protein [Candidatus Krumholzibacteria bacterium]